MYMYQTFPESQFSLLLVGCKNTHNHFPHADISIKQICHASMLDCAFLVNSRDVWSDHDHFGSAEISAEDEFICLCDIFKMDLPSGKLVIIPFACTI